ncbi:alpha/beta hydrolase [bacterium]|nr:alpha/beta hydrolase [bacterium]
MKPSIFFSATLTLLAACGTRTNDESTLSSDRFAISVFGIEMGSCTQDELKRFVAGEDVAAISGKLPKEQQIELRQKFARVIHVSSARSDEAFSSPAGEEVRSLLGAIFPSSYSEASVKAAFEQSIADDEFTLLEFVSLYPTKDLKVNGLAFMGKKDKLELALAKMEDQFRN